MDAPFKASGCGIALTLISGFIAFALVFLMREASALETAELQP